MSLSDHRALWLPLFLSVFPWIAGCDSSGSDTNLVTIRYAGDASAYGVTIRAGTVAATADTKLEENASCTMSAAAAAAGCTSSVETSAAEVNLALYGCFAEAGDELFDCELSAGLVESLRAHATVRAGCGCRVCPSAPAIAVCEKGTMDCGEAPLLEANVADAPRPDLVATTQPGTGETTCSTCCETDFFEDEVGTLVSDEAVSEIQFQVTFSEECEFDFNGKAECDVLHDAADHWTKIEVFDGRLVKRFCFAGRNPGEEALSVPLVSCRGLIVDTSVTRAIGRDFTPLSSVPTVVFE